MMHVRSAYASGLEGQMIGDQTIISRAPNQNGAVYWVVRCACGAERPVAIRSLIARGQQKRCGRCSAANQTGPLSPQWQGGRTVPLTHYNKFKKSAARRNIEWRLTIANLDELFDAQGGICALTEEPLFFDNGSRNGVERGNASLDRVDAGGIYEIGNIQFLTKAVNMAKQTMTNEEFALLCMRVVQRLL